MVQESGYSGPDPNLDSCEIGLDPDSNMRKTFMRSIIYKAILYTLSHGVIVSLTLLADQLHNLWAYGSCLGCDRDVAKSMDFGKKADGATCYYISTKIVKYKKSHLTETPRLCYSFRT